MFIKKKLLPIKATYLNIVERNFQKFLKMSMLNTFKKLSTEFQSWKIVTFSSRCLILEWNKCRVWRTSRLYTFSSDFVSRRSLFPSLYWSTVVRSVQSFWNKNRLSLRMNRLEKILFFVKVLNLGTKQVLCAKNI